MTSSDLGGGMACPPSCRGHVCIGHLYSCVVINAHEGVKGALILHQTGFLVSLRAQSCASCLSALSQCCFSPFSVLFPPCLLLRFSWAAWRVGALGSRWAGARLSFRSICPIFATRPLGSLWEARLILWKLWLPEWKCSLLTHVTESHDRIL